MRQSNITTRKPHHSHLSTKTTTRGHHHPNAYRTSRKPSVSVIGDSNTRALDPTKMIQTCHIKVQEAPTTREAAQTVAETVDDVTVLHVGTNDLLSASPQDTANNIIRMVTDITRCGGKVVLSKLLPRDGYTLNQKVYETNCILENHFQHTSAVYLTNTDIFYYGERPNRYLYTQEYRDNYKKPLLHLNKSGLIELSREIQRGLRHFLWE